jgi:phosphatidylserine/phosphatidylglycerophosphate/cardiolipin synthase-like enzyme
MSSFPANRRGSGELRELEHRYLAAGPDFPLHREDTTWRPLIDGTEYLPMLAEEIAATRAGDAVYISAFQLGVDTDLNGRDPDDPNALPIGEQLARKAAEGVDVRVIFAGGAVGSLPAPLGPFRLNLVSAHRLRHWTPAGASAGEHPLTRAVLLDWSGHPLGSNHQKFVLVRRSDDLVAFVGGMDIDRYRFDGTPHDRYEVSGRRWGWHDAAQRIAGAATARVWELFRARWLETTSLPRRLFWLPPASPRLMNPPPHLPDPGPAPPQRPRRAPGTSVQVARSFGWRKHLGLTMTPVRWREFPRHGVREIFELLSTAIAGARRYVYVEDQYFREFPGAKRRFSPFPPVRRALERGVKVIFVCSGVDNDASKSPSNRTLNGEVVRQLVDPLPPEHRANFVFYRVEHLTVHSKVVLIDDVFACIGSANFFSRSMSGVDHELSVGVVDTGRAVRDLRVRLWAEHLRVEPGARGELDDLDRALGIWRPEWGAGIRAQSAEPVLKLVGPAIEATGRASETRTGV